MQQDIIEKKKQTEALVTGAEKVLEQDEPDTHVGFVFYN